MGGRSHPVQNDDEGVPCQRDKFDQFKDAAQSKGATEYGQDREYRDQVTTLFHAREGPESSNQRSLDRLEPMADEKRWRPD